MQLRALCASMNVECGVVCTVGWVMFADTNCMCVSDHQMMIYLVILTAKWNVFGYVLCLINCY